MSYEKMKMLCASDYALQIPVSDKNIPEIMQYRTYLNPLRYFLVIICGIFKGYRHRHIWSQEAVLFVLGAVAITVSFLCFKKRFA